MPDIPEQVTQLELAILKAFQDCDDLTDTGALWAALDSTVYSSASNRIKELGGDVDRVRSSLDSYFLQNP